MPKGGLVALSPQNQITQAIAAKFQRKRNILNFSLLRSLKKKKKKN